MSAEAKRGTVYTVDRGVKRAVVGQGLGTGLGVVIKHFAAAMTKKLDTPSETSGVFTVQYPEEQLPLPQASRNFPILLYDDATGQELCTSCYQCQRVCPPQVIHMTQAKDPVTGKAVPAVSEFIIEYDACMSCGLCAEVCPFDAIKMDHAFELATDYHSGLTVDRAGLDRPISYYAELAPTFWEEARDNALKKLQGNARRRPGAIGIAPSMIGRVPENPPSTPPAPVAAAPTPAATPSEAPATEDKAARLAAIRARNAAKTAGEITEVAPAAPAAPLTPAEEKAARLAAIRARNAAKAQAEHDPVAPAESAPIETTKPATPADEKAARLAAIRARNAAKKAQAEE